MFFPTHHKETSTENLFQFIRDNPLGLFITAVPSPDHAVLQCSHLPWVLDTEISQISNPSESGAIQGIKLRGHIARQNPQSKAIINAAQGGSGSSDDNQSAKELPLPPYTLESEVLILFNGPAHHYVTPKFYTETKPTTGKVVPTWNYSAVQVYGRATVYYDSHSDETDRFLSRQMADLSRHCEAHVMGYTGPENGQKAPWEVSDAPERYVELLKKNIVGLEIAVDRVEGKYKMNQEMSKGDRAGVVEGFHSLGTELGEQMARTVDERGKLKDALKASSN